MLEGSCGDTTVILSGPASSFPEGTELSILVQEPAEEDQEVIEEAVEKQAEDQEMEVKSYTALDIRLLSNGEEIQPLGPVSVKFQQPEQQERTAEETSTQVLHVDESTGDATDMEAEVTEDGEVAIETTHFSIYVVVDLNRLGGEIELTVQHWATINQLVKDQVNGTGTTGLDINGNTATLKSEDVFTRIYTDDTITLYNLTSHKVDDLSKVLLADANVTNPDEKRYILSEIWFLKEGKNRESTSRDDWEIYSPTAEKSLQLSKDAVIRMVYAPVSENSAFQKNVRFYDYNVMGGTTGKTEYSQWGTAFFTVRSDLGINDHAGNLMVGQGTAGFPHSQTNAKFNGKFLNKGNGTPATAVTGMVKNQLDSNGDLQFSDGISANHLFDNTSVAGNGKQILDGYQLSFDRIGDVYTLSSVSNTNTNQTVLSGLDTIRDIGGAWSNNFWPLDGISYTGKDLEFGGHTNRWRGKDRDEITSEISPSDDKKYHNWFFGMRYEFEFTIGDYEGPLNFYFRGDDDFWLYVDGELKVDLGGIHSAIGSYLDLSYLRDNPEERNKTHTISIFYAERGAFGSCCYMQFTLPNVKSVDFDTEPEYTSVTVEKKWEDHNNPNRPGYVEVELSYRREGTENWNKYNTARLSVANNWKCTWQNLPKTGYEYKVKEVGEENGENGNYTVSYSPKSDGQLVQNSDGTYSGTITNRASPSTTINVTKVWDDGNNASGARPDSVDFFLYYRNQDEADWKPYPDGKLTLTKNQNWKGSYTNLPVYAGDTDSLLEYTVMEISGDDPLMEGEKLPGKSTGQENFQYTVSYDKENHCGTGNQWTGYVAEEGITLDLTVTNSLGREIEVIKQWKGTLESKIPDSIYVGLYLKNSEGVEKPVSGKTLQLTKAGGWKGSFKYLGEGDYTVKELQETTDSGPADFTIDDTKKYIGINDGGSVTIKDVEYDVTYSHSQGTATNNKTTYYTITNQGSWQIIKKSKSGDLFLEGAEFTLTLDGSNQVYTGTSAETTGLVTWQGVDIATIDSGTYTLTEKTAPIGYQPGGTWKITITNGVPTFVEKTNSDGSTDNTDKGKYVDGILTFYYENEALYALPDSGGTGIYGYVLGGMLFMTAAVLMLYKQRLGGGAGRKRR
ncbi:Cna B-type domain-containing protein [Lacrimispora saccharolytica]|nr:Cna B-type domain-containing protein [Lacrimispora saccharolytica]